MLVTVKSCNFGILPSIQTFPLTLKNQSTLREVARERASLWDLPVLIGSTLPRCTCVCARRHKVQPLELCRRLSYGSCRCVSVVKSERLGLLCWCSASDPKLSELHTGGWGRNENIMGTKSQNKRNGSPWKKFARVFGHCVNGFRICASVFLPD